MEQSSQSSQISFSLAFAQAVDFWKAHAKVMLGCSLAVFVFLLLGFELIGGWQNSFFLPWGFLFYLFWYGFFRFVFERKPYLKCGRIFQSLIPATKIFTIAFIVGTFLLLIPYAPYVMNVPVEVKENYEVFQKRYMQDSDAYDVVLNLIFVFLAPQVILRPFMAWISSVIGRSWSIMTAWNKTENSYGLLWGLTFFADVFYLTFGYLAQVGVPMILVWLLAAPLVVFAFLILSRVYAFYFLSLTD